MCRLLANYHRQTGESACAHTAEARKSQAAAPTLCNNKLKNTRLYPLTCCLGRVQKVLPTLITTWQVALHERMLTQSPVPHQAAASPQLR